MADKTGPGNLGKSKKSAKGAHGGGTPYKQMEPKRPNFVLGKGFKDRSKPGESSENKMP